MKHRATKAVVLILVALLILSVLAACSTKVVKNPTEPAKSGGTEPASSDKNSQQAKEPEPLTLPIVKEPLTLTYFRAMDAKVAATMKEYNDIRCYQELERLTGIHIQWLHPPAGQETEQFNLMLASQDLPDMVWWNWLTVAGGPAKVIQDGAIVKLNDLIDQYAPNFKKLLDQNAEVRKQSMLDDGTFYMFPFVRGDESLRVCGGFQMRKDWLDKLGLKPPTTMDEWYNVLTAFKQKDPNGNGQPDELPFVSSKAGGLQNFEMAFGMFHGFYQVNGKIKYSPIEPAYKDFLAVMAKWYKEGLIDPDYASTDGKNFDAKITQNLGGSYNGAVDGNLGRYMRLMKDKDLKFELIGVPWPKAPDGKVYGNRDRAVPGQGLALTSKNKHLKESVKWADYAFTKEGGMLLNFGPEGEAYELVNGYPKYKDIVMNNPDGLPFDQAAIRYGVAVGAEGAMVQDPRYYEQSLTDFPQKKAAVDTWRQHDPSLLLPPITPTSEESQQLASIMNEITTYVDEMFNKFVMGQEPLQNFDKYVQTIKSMGIDNAIKIQQAALDRYNARK